MARLFSVVAVILAATVSYAAIAGEYGAPVATGCAGQEDNSRRGDFRKAMELLDRGMYDRAGEMFSDIAAATGNIDAEGYGVLCSIKSGLEGNKEFARAYLWKYPYALPAAQVRFALAVSLFDAEEYAAASAEFSLVPQSSLRRSQRPEYLFKRAYSDFETGNYEQASRNFRLLDRFPSSDYAAAARYMLGYISYEEGRFSEALQWFRQSLKDSRFASMSRYYEAECRFMLKEYRWMTDSGPALLESVPQECRDKLRRMISESYLVLGDAGEAMHYYGDNASASVPKSRADYFYAGSVLYAVEDYQGAVDNFSLMESRTDSIGQAANYKLGYSYIRIRNKVAALDAFKAASAVDYDAAIAEDAFYNYAKLSFDLNNDVSVFEKYLEKYPDTGKKEMIYSYIAVAALMAHDYEGAIDAYSNIDVLDEGMKSNYMKANYLRAAELVSNGSFRAAVPCLKAAVYYSDRRDMFSQMSRYWLAESYYRDDRFSDALGEYTALYNVSALYGMEESRLLPYDIAYCHFKMEDYTSAARWYREYLSGDDPAQRKDALLRYADCLFMQRDYQGASSAYGEVLSGYFDINDIYPYYQAAISSGLSGDSGKKISLLKNVINADAASAFYPEALFELGRSYVSDGNEAQAAVCYKKLIKDVKDSTFVARSLIELGMISRNMSRYDEAAGYYKTVVEKMPYSGYADDALLAIESIYRSQNEPQKYLDYIEQIGKASLKSADEREMMIFSAAEQIYLSENYQRALASLQSYIDTYPQGAQVPKAWFYMAECYKNLGKPDQACDCYVKVMDSQDAAYTELACLNFASLAYSLYRYDDAYRAYVSLLEMAGIENNRHAARVGMMRSAFRARRYEDAAVCAKNVLEDSRTDSDVSREAEYVLAKSCLATSRRDEAYEIFSRLSAWPSTPEGAEATYLLILDSYDRGDFDDVETRVYSFSDLASGQTYWLAKAFVTLGDSFVERGEYEQAMATFNSILEGYEPSSDDDVIDGVRMRIDKLVEIMGQVSSTEN